MRHWLVHVGVAPRHFHGVAESNSSLANLSHRREPLDRRVGRYWTLVGIINGWEPNEAPSDIIDAWEGRVAFAEPNSLGTTPKRRSRLAALRAYAPPSTPRGDLNSWTGTISVI